MLRAKLSGGKPMPGTEPNRDEAIRQLAYRFWQEAGYPEGNEVQHWLKAETIWLEEQRTPREAKQAKAAKARKPRKSHATDRDL
jgi:hypothetical protein